MCFFIMQAVQGWNGTSPQILGTQTPSIHPKCLIHKFENIYKPRDSIKKFIKGCWIRSHTKERKGTAWERTDSLL